MESSRSTDWTHIPYIGRQILNLWTSRKVRCSHFWFDFLTTIKLRAASMKDNWSGRYVKYFILLISSVSQFRSSVMSDYLWPHESQHTRPPRPSPTPGVYSNSCPSSQWCHPAISSSVVPFSSCSQSLPASGSFPTSQLFAWGGQNIELSASASVLPVNTQDLFPSGWTGRLTLQSKGLSRVFSNTTVQKHQFLAFSFLHSTTLTSIHDHWKNHSLDQTDLCWQSNVSAF